MLHDPEGKAKLEGVINIYKNLPFHKNPELLESVPRPMLVMVIDVLVQLLTQIYGISDSK